MSGLVAAGLRVLPSAGHHPSLPGPRTPCRVGPPAPGGRLLAARLGALPAHLPALCRAPRGGSQPPPCRRAPAHLRPRRPWCRGAWRAICASLASCPTGCSFPYSVCCGATRGRASRSRSQGGIHESGRNVAERHIHDDFLRESFARTHRWQRVSRHVDEPVSTLDDRVVRVLFSTALDAINLYDKPMARNSQIWTDDYQLVLDGPRATPELIARPGIDRGGRHIRLSLRLPADAPGRRELFWHRPLVASAPRRDRGRHAQTRPVGRGRRAAPGRPGRGHRRAVAAPAGASA